MGVYSSTAANAYADKIKAVYEYLDEIRKVADRLTPVEDLTIFQAQIQALYDQLDLLVEASNLIVTATPTGEAILTGSVPSIQALLEIGVLPPDLVHQGDLDAALAALKALIDADIANATGTIHEINDSITQLDQYRQSQQSEISGLQTSYNNIVAGLETNQTNTESALQRLTVQEQWATLVDERFDSISQSLDSTVLGLQGANDIIAGHTATIETYGNQISLNASSIDALASNLVDVENDIAANTTAINSLDTQITQVGDDLTAQSQQLTELKSVVGGSGNLLANADFAVGANGWNIVVAEDDWASSVLEVNAFNMPPEVNALSILGTPTPDGEIVVESPAVLIDGEGHYIVSGYPCVDNGTVTLSYKEYDLFGDVIGQGECPVTFNVTTNANFKNYTRTWVKFLASADTVKIRLYLTGWSNGDFISQVALFRPMVEKAGVDQTKPSAWTPNTSGATEALAEAVQTLTTETSLINGQLSSMSAAQTSLLSRVGTVEGALINEMITRSNQHGATVASLNTLSASLDDAETQLAANAVAISGLQSDVSTLEGTVSSHSSSLTSLQAQVDAIDEGTGGSGAAISALDVRVTATENSIDSMSSAITALESSVTSANKIYAQNSPPPTVGGTTGDLWIDTDDNNKIYTLTGGAWVPRPDTSKNTVFRQDTQPTANAPGDLWIQTPSNKVWYWNGTTWLDSTDSRTTANATAITELTTRVTAAEGVNTSQGSAITALQNTVNSPTTGVTATATALSSLTTRVTNVENTNTSQASAITNVTSRITTAESNITNQASATTALTTRVTTVEGKAATMEAKYTLTLNVNGYISGFTSINTGASADFNVSADKFKITAPAGGARTEFSAGNWRVYDSSGTLRVRMGVW
jgi:predicted  nucleic acid-binding Zn-ribbon protein